MNNRLRLYLWVIFGILILVLGVVLIWGNTLRMALANHYYTKADYDQAQERYEDLLVDLPNSPCILHNLGLAFIKKERFDKAVSNLREAIGGLEGLSLNKSRKKQLKNVFSYNSGNALYDSVEKNQDGDRASIYQEALENFKQAIEANPKDLDAKYNYELTLLRLKHLPQQSKEPEQNEAQNIMNMNDAQFYAPPQDEQPVTKDW